MLQQRGIEGVRVLLGLLSLANRHPAEAIEQACETALTHGAYRLRTIRELLKRQGDRQEQFEFTAGTSDHPGAVGVRGIWCTTAFTIRSHEA